MNYRSLLFSLLVEVVCAARPIETEYYDLLQLSTTATQQEIRQAYKKLAVKLHPDKNPDANEQFLKVLKAYETLKDPEKRLQYDLHGPHQTYARRYDSHSQSEYNNLFYNGLYAGDEFVDNLSQDNYYNYLLDGFHFINFYSPFCPPCQKLSDTWKQLAENFKNLVRVAAVNCKYQSNFCYNTIRIASYPTLLFYENAKNRRYIIYKGGHSYESLENFLMQYIEKEVSITIDKLKLSGNLPTIYIIGAKWNNKNIITRVSWKLKGVAEVVKISDEGLRRRLTREEYVTAVMDVRGERHHITATEEADLLRDIARYLDHRQPITTDELWSIRNTLRNEADKKPWAFYFVNGENGDRLIVQKMTRRFPDLQFGEIDCDTSPQLCLSLQVGDTPTWGVLKTGGAYERLHGRADLRHVTNFLQVAPHTHNLQTLSVSEFTRIVRGDAGMWVVAVIPHKLSWDHMTGDFVEASRKFEDIQFGVMMCQPSSARICNPIALNSAVVMVQNKTRRFTYRGRQETGSLADFLDNVMDNSGTELTESDFHEMLKRRSIEHSWTIAFFPEDCDSNCEQLRLEWKIVTRKLVPYGKIKIASIDCGSAKKLCEQSNIRSPILRLYPASASNSYVAHMTSFSKAAYMLEWLLNIADDSVRQLTQATFAGNVLSSTFDDHLSPSSKSAWLVYFHSPRCHHCFEMYTDFFIAAKMLEDRVNMGKVNCLQEHQLCNHEQITRYPSIKLYVKDHSKTKSLHFRAQSYKILMQDIEAHLPSADLGNIRKVSIDLESHLHHDEF